MTELKDGCRGACEARLARMEVSPPTHTSFGIVEYYIRNSTVKYTDVSMSSALGVGNNFQTDNGHTWHSLQVRRAIDDRNEGCRGACEARLARMEVSPPTNTSFAIAENNKRTSPVKYT